MTDFTTPLLRRAAAWLDCTGSAPRFAIVAAIVVAIASSSR